jgi:hypothetical protein
MPLESHVFVYTQNMLFNAVRGERDRNRERKRETGRQTDEERERERERESQSGRGERGHLANQDSSPNSSGTVA